jgi:threonine/homoserine/homoserine lactone efflux protein
MLHTLGIHDLGLFMLTGLVLNLTPGADTLLVVSRSAAGGWRQGALAALGIQLGCLVHATAAALGVAALLAASAQAFQVLTWVGAAYLAWLGYKMLREGVWPARPAHAGTNPAVAGATAAPRAAGNAFMQGLLTNVLNPKVGLFFLAFVPQFIRPDAASPVAAFLTLGAVFDLTGGTWLLIVAALTVRLRSAVSPLLGRWLQGLGGTLFLGLAWRLATDRKGA